MRCARLLLLICLTTSSHAVSASAGDWVTAPSFYTHDPQTGLRINRYTSPPPAVVPHSQTFRDSGFRHYRSTLQYAQTADNYHRVEQWGPPVQPYGEWRFPNRPYSAPYSQWGAPLAGLNLGGYGYGYGNWGSGYPGGPPPGRNDDHGYGPGNRPGQPLSPFQPNFPYPSGPGNPYPVPPYADGYYPNYPERPRLDDSEFFDKPGQ